MKLIPLILITLSMTATAYGKSTSCQFKLSGVDIPDKEFSSPASMTFEACQDFANLHMLQNAKKYNQIKYKHESQDKWITLELKDAKEEVAHP